ncbi:unnamed protein product [Mortierella alpina]
MFLEEDGSVPVREGLEQVVQDAVCDGSEHESAADDCLRPHLRAGWRSTRRYPSGGRGTVHSAHLPPFQPRRKNSICQTLLAHSVSSRTLLLGQHEFQRLSSQK